MGDLEADPVSAPWERPPPEPIRMMLKGTADLRGTVTDLATRAPIRRAVVRITPDPYDGRSGRTVYTNAKGEFAALRMLPGRWKLLPKFSGYLPAQPQVVDLVRAGERHVDLRLDPGEVFAGVVQDERGTPLRYARVRVRGRPFDAERDVTRAANTDAKGAVPPDRLPAGRLRGARLPPGLPRGGRARRAPRRRQHALHPQEALTFESPPSGRSTVSV